MYTVDYFIEKFSAIPLNKWTTGVFRDWNNNKCALGHTMTDRVIDATIDVFEKSGKRSFPKSECVKYEEDLKECYALCKLFNENKPSKGSEMIIYINNGEDKRYKQPSPKARILAALRDLKPKEKIRYVSVPETVKEQSSELILN